MWAFKIYIYFLQNEEEEQLPAAVPSPSMCKKCIVNSKLSWRRSQRPIKVAFLFLCLCLLLTDSSLRGRSISQVRRFPSLNLPVQSHATSTWDSVFSFIRFLHLLSLIISSSKSERLCPDAHNYWKWWWWRPCGGPGAGAESVQLGAEREGSKGWEMQLHVTVLLYCSTSIICFFLIWLTSPEWAKSETNCQSIKEEGGEIKQVTLQKWLPECTTNSSRNSNNGANTTFFISSGGSPVFIIKLQHRDVNTVRTDIHTQTERGELYKREDKQKINFARKRAKPCSVKVLSISALQIQSNPIEREK